VTGTNALKDCTNRNEIINSIKEEFNFDLRVISGKEEANYAFLGSTEGVVTDLPKLVIDIGGGSTELILGNEYEIIYSESFPFGAVSLTEKFIQNEIPLKDSIAMNEGIYSDQKLKKYQKNCLLNF
jgi:exopolyphosphatase/guanosine-5'-triphosphate,3'-diphosphate pyrophosphatase